MFETKLLNYIPFDLRLAICAVQLIKTSTNEEEGFLF